MLLDDGFIEFYTNPRRIRYSDVTVPEKWLGNPSYKV